MIKRYTMLLFAALLATSCSTTRRADEVRFEEQEKANLIVRYYTDDTSYLLKPAARQGQFLSILNKDGVLRVAQQQPARDLAVVILIHYGSPAQTEMVKTKWKGLLTEAGYQRVVFLRGQNGMRVQGLPVLASGSESRGLQATAAAPGKSVADWLASGQPGW